MALGVILIAIGLALVVGSAAFARWTANVEENNRFWYTPFRGSTLVNVRRISTFVLGVAFIVVGVAAALADLR